MRKLLVGVAAVAMVALSTAAASATSTVTLPQPGTAAQVAKLVTASTSITTLPTTLKPGLVSVPTDTSSYTKYKASGIGCRVLNKACSYGKLSSKKVVVVLGDSHVWMWIPALVPEMTKLGYRMDLLWVPGCVAADLNLYGVLSTTSYDTDCNTWRASTLTLIKSMHPAVVLIAERTADLESGPGVEFTDQQVTAGLKTTINAVKGPKTKVAIIGDDPEFANFLDPTACLSYNLTAVQNCATPVVNPSAQWNNHVAAEQAAAKATKSTFINTVPWLCNTKLATPSCSPIIGNMPVYIDWSHVTATYAAYLSGVMGTALKPLL